MSDMPERDLELACMRELSEHLGRPFETLAEKAARLEAEQGPQPTVRATRYYCPMPGCGWTHDAPDPGIETMADIRPDPGAVTLQDMMSSVAFQATLRHVQAVDAVLAEHCGTHGLAEWVAAVTAAQDERAKLAARTRDALALAEQYEAEGSRLAAAFRRILTGETL